MAPRSCVREGFLNRGGFQIGGGEGGSPRFGGVPEIRWVEGFPRVGRKVIWDAQLRDSLSSNQESLRSID